jgi:hypothetical protein
MAKEIPTRRPRNLASVRTAAHWLRLLSIGCGTSPGGAEECGLSPRIQQHRHRRVRFAAWHIACARAAERRSDGDRASARANLRRSHRWLTTRRSSKVFCGHLWAGCANATSKARSHYLSMRPFFSGRSSVRRQRATPNYRPSSGESSPDPRRTAGMGIVERARDGRPGLVRGPCDSRPPAGTREANERHHIGSAGRCDVTRMLNGCLLSSMARSQLPMGGREHCSRCYEAVRALQPDPPSATRPVHGGAR